MPIEIHPHHLRIVHVFSNYLLFSKGGGVERYIHQVASKSALAGHSATVVAHAADEAPENLPYRIRSGGYAELWREIGLATTVHIHGPRTFYSAMAGIMAILRGRHLFYTAHCFYEGKTRWQSFQKWCWDRSIERLLFRRAQSVILLSDYWHQFVLTLKLHPHHVAILPNGIDVAALAGTTPPALTLAGKPAILSVSRLDPIKRIEDIIGALAEPGLEEAHLHIVGRGPDEERLIAIAQHHGFADRVTFHHFKSDEEVASMARAAQVFVLASAEEGMPTSILEMLAFGLPVVASQIPGNLSIMERMRNPSTYPMGDQKALAQKILEAIHKPLPADTISNLYALFDWNAIVATMLTLYSFAYADRSE